jgi:predicted O-linked N-acetylglucosamine transferase (SPINDLY family)
MEVSEYIAGVNQALVLFNRGEIDESLNACTSLIEAKPERKGAYLLLAQIYSKKGEPQKAQEILGFGLKATEDPVFQVSLGILQSKMNLYDQALKSFAQVKHGSDKNELYHLHYAKSLAACGRNQEAIDEYEKCLQLKPDNKQALNNLANLMQKSGKRSKAKNYLQRLIELYPDEAIAYTNIGSLYEKSNEIDKAKKYYEKSLKLDPTLSITYFNLAQLLGGHLNDYTGALSLLQTGLKVGDSSYQKGLRLYQIIYRQYVADWSEYDKDVDDLDQILEEYLSENSNLPFEIVPYTLSHAKVDNQRYRRIAVRYAKTVERRVKQKYPTITYNHSLSVGKIKIGYYSPNMRSHPGGLLVRKLFDYHDSGKFEVHAFSLVTSDDFVSQEIKDSVDYFHDVSKLDTLEIANLINRTGIDILVSLAFYNTSMNVEVLALKPAPIQMVLIGSHETTGATFIDYAFSDESMMDVDIRNNFTENIITLPCSLLINSELPTDSSLKTIPKDHDLPNEAFVFASFNHPRKLDRETVDAWMEILKGAENAVLWMYDGGHEHVREVIMKIAISKEVNKERIIFASPVDPKKHWERLHHVDLLLDSFIYNAHATGIEALRMGVPMITLRGSNHNSRLGASLMHYANLSTCIILTKNDYIQRSIQLATHPKELESIRKSLQSGSDKLIFDTELQVKYLEKAYQKVFLRLIKKQPPKDLSVGSALRLDSLI